MNQRRKRKIARRFNFQNMRIITHLIKNISNGHKVNLAKNAKTVLFYLE